MNYIIKCFVFSASKKFKFEYRVLSSPILLKISVRSSASSLNFSSSCLLTSIFGKFLLCCFDRFVSFKPTSFFFRNYLYCIFFIISDVSKRFNCLLLVLVVIAALFLAKIAALEGVEAL